MPIEYKPEDIDYITWSMRMADWDRAQRRTQINALFNGTPPYSKKEQEDSGITINVNDLSGPRAAHEARAQFNASFMKPGAYFNCRTDTGRKDKRQAYGRTVTTEAAKIMKRSIAYTETQRSKWAMTILHGISPCVFKDADCWRPRAIGIEDILVPSNTELMDIAEGEMTFIPVYRTFNGNVHEFGVRRHQNVLDANGARSPEIRDRVVVLPALHNRVSPVPRDEQRCDVGTGRTRMDACSGQQQDSSREQG